LDLSTAVRFRYFAAVAGVCKRAGGVFLLALATAGTVQAAETVYLVGDAHTDSAAPAAANGSAASLRVSPASATYILFDLTAVPAGMTVEQAMLVVRPLRVLAAGVVGAHPASAAWNEDTLKHENRPAWSEAPVALQLVNEESASGGDLTFSVTAAAAGWLAGSANHGIALVGDGLVDIDLASKENPAVAHPPRLELVLVPAAPPAP
jgi:hypothetical protein